MINHRPQKELKKKIYTQKNQIKKEKPTKKIITDDDDWIYVDSGEVLDDDRDCSWITCDICSSNYHLECSEIEYPTEHYWDIDLNSSEFECPDCVVYFQSD